MQKCVWQTNIIQLLFREVIVLKKLRNIHCLLCLVLWKNTGIAGCTQKNGQRFFLIEYILDFCLHLVWNSKISINIVLWRTADVLMFSWSICACFQVPHFTSATWTKRTDCDKAEKPTCKSLGTGFFQIPWKLLKTLDWWVHVGYWRFFFN